MDESYYTDEMREFVAGLENIHEFPVTITLSQDDEGPFVCLLFKEDDHNKYGQDRLIIEEVATYLVDLRNGLIDLGARVTFVVEAREQT